MMQHIIFSELYCAYYNAVAEILSSVIRGEKDEKNLQEIVLRHAFSESVLTILPSLKSGKWQLLKNDMTTPIQNPPTMPLTMLEKRWLKAISSDPRIHLFGTSFDMYFDGLENIEPLFTPQDFVIYDKYTDGDPYSDERYVSHFRTILSALREKCTLTVEMLNRKSNPIQMDILPKRLEYSEKDDKFRLIASEGQHTFTINIARIITCKKCTDKISASKTSNNLHSEIPLQRKVTLRICDERNALERCMLHFAHFKKQAERIDDRHYHVHIQYNREDETEMVIRILSFGPLIEVTEPQSFRKLIIERLQRQKSKLPPVDSIRLA